MKPRKGLSDIRLETNIVDDKAKFIQTLNDMFVRLDSTINEVQNTVYELSAAGRASTCIVLPDFVINTPKGTLAALKKPFPINISTPVPVAGLVLLMITDTQNAGSVGIYGTTATAPAMFAVPVPGMIQRNTASQDIGEFAQQSQQWQITYITGLSESHSYLCRVAGIRYATPADLKPSWGDTNVGVGTPDGGE